MAGESEIAKYLEKARQLLELADEPHHKEHRELLIDCATDLVRLAAEAGSFSGPQDEH